MTDCYISILYFFLYIVLRVGPVIKYSQYAVDMVFFQLFHMVQDPDVAQIDVSLLFVALLHRIDVTYVGFFLHALIV
jgi:hypothetical protein